MKWKPKNDTVGVPGRGFIKAEDYNQQDENNLQARAKNRGLDFNIFMLGAGFVPVQGPQLELQVDDEEFEVEPIEEKPKRTRRTKAEIEASK